MIATQPIDSIVLEITPGGIRATVERVTPANHVNVAVFLAAIERLLGGTTTRRRHPNAPPLPAAVRDALAQALTAALVADHRRRMVEQQAPKESEETAR